MAEIDRLVSIEGCAMFHLTGPKELYFGEDTPAVYRAAVDAVCAFCGSEETTLVYMDGTGKVLGAICDPCCVQRPVEAKQCIGGHADAYVGSLIAVAQSGGSAYGNLKLIVDRVDRRDWSGTMQEQLEQQLQRIVEDDSKDQAE